MRIALLIQVLLAGSLLATSVAVAEPDDGPPPPLEGVPLDFVCDVQLPAGHPLLARQPGQDLRDLAQSDDVDLQAWLRGHLCDMIWGLLDEGGAHPQPRDVRLPARAILQVELAVAELEGTRIVDQRVGSTVMPVAVPHWALDMTWIVRFSIHYRRDGQEYQRGPPMELALRERAEQEDYTPLRLGALLRTATLRALRGLPRILVDEGGLGDLLFGVVEAPGKAPRGFGVSGPLADGFWNLLAPAASHRHDALAFYLASDAPPRRARIDLARWFVLNDSDVAVRRDALAWLMNQEAPADAEEELTADTAELLRWLLVRDTSPRMRTEAAGTLVDRSGQRVRELLLVASSDQDRRVSDLANSALRRFAPATSVEMAGLDRAPAAPRVSDWTTALDGRIVPPAGSADHHLLTLARAAGGPAAETWTARWLRHGTVSEGDLDWALPAWRAVASTGSARLRREAIDRLSREADTSTEAESILVERILEETDPELRVRAIDALERRGVPGAADALLAASGDQVAAVRAAAALALAEVSDPRAAGRLEDLTEDPDPKVRRKAKRALRKRSR